MRPFQPLFKNSHLATIAGNFWPRPESERRWPVTDVKVVSPTEITWRMKKSYAPYASILSWTFIVPAHILGKADDPNTAPFNNAPVGTGAFRWGERVPGDHITLVANQHYYGKGPYLERLVFHYVPDLTALYTQFQTGAIDHTTIQGITADHYNEAIKIPGRVVTAGPSGSCESIYGIDNNHESAA